MKAGFPSIGRNQAVGLFGGTFDPVHEGHLLAAKRALRRAELDQIWWIPSPGNPLKSRQPAPMSARIAAIENAILDPKMKVADLETALGTRYTIDTLHRLQSLYPTVKFVLIFGADILAELHRWRHWKALVKSAPICAIARPSQQLRAGLSPFAQSFARYRLEPEEASLLKYQNAPAWCLVPGMMNAQSSTKIRAQNGAH